MNSSKSATTCTCGSTLPYSQCCGPLLDGMRTADTAESLMRSRYSAYCRGDRDYLLQTWAMETRPKDLVLDNTQHWLGLKIKNTQAGLSEDSEGMVHFVARYKIAGRGYRLEEKSRFKRVNGKWTYFDGEIIDAKQ